MIVKTKVGQSLMDIAVENSQMEDILIIARANDLPIDYCFEKTQRINVPDEVVSRKDLGRLSTGENGESEAKWWLKGGEQQEEGCWVDSEFWRD